MPDDQDYAELGRLLASPMSWSTSDAAAARSALRAQQDAAAGVHPRDARRRVAMQAVVDDLRAAVAVYESRER